jgi:hypothetical protein
MCHQYIWIPTTHQVRPHRPRVLDPCAFWGEGLGRQMAEGGFEIEDPTSEHRHVSLQGPTVVFELHYALGFASMNGVPTSSKEIALPSLE